MNKRRPGKKVGMSRTWVEGDTALKIAMDRKFPDCVKVLKEAGGIA